MKSVDKFLNYLEERELYKLSPEAFTLREILLFAHSKGFNVSRESLRAKIKQLKQRNIAESRIERIWQQSECVGF